MRRWDRWRRWQCIALRTKMAGSCTRCHKLIGEWIQRLSKMGCPLAELKETSTTCYWTKTVIESMILTKFHSITHHSSRINYVGQFDVNVGWTQRSVEETWLFVTSKSQPNKCLVKPRRQRLQRWTPSSITLDRVSYLKNDAARNPTALWNLLQNFRRLSLPDPIYRFK